MSGVAARPVHIVLLAGGLLLGGCMVGPDYQRPALDMPSSYREPAPIDDTFANLPWWGLFADPALDALIEEALANNRDLGVALARIEEAAAILSVVRANQFPFFDIQAGAGRTSTSEDVLGGGVTDNSFSLGGVASFEVDLWGKLRRATEAARADLLSTEAAARNVTISLIASVAGGGMTAAGIPAAVCGSDRTASGAAGRSASVAAEQVASTEKSSPSRPPISMIDPPDAGRASRSSDEESTTIAAGACTSGVGTV